MNVPDFAVEWGSALTCGECGIYFIAPAKWERDKRENGQTFHCPNGHARCFRESTVDKLKAQLAAKERELEQRRKDVDRVSRSRDAFKGQLRKAKVRISNGVCPCCNRSFSNLGRHMAGQHPDWKDQEIG
jgi:hypothetical protein